MKLQLLLYIYLNISTTLGVVYNYKSNSCNLLNNFFNTYGYDINEYCCKNYRILCDANDFITEMYGGVFIIKKPIYDLY